MSEGGDSLRGGRGEGWAPQLAFDSDDPEFTCGLEAADVYRVYRDAVLVAEDEHPHHPGAP